MMSSITVAHLAQGVQDQDDIKTSSRDGAVPGKKHKAGVTTQEASVMG